MKIKNPHSTKSNESQSKKLVPTPYQTIKDLWAWRTVDCTPILFEEIADFMIQWSLKPDSISIKSGLRAFGIPRFKYDEWLHKSEKMQFAHREALENIGENLLRLGMNRKADPSFIHGRLTIYHEDFAFIQKEERDFKEKLADKRNAATQKMLENTVFIQREVKSHPLVDQALKHHKDTDGDSEND